MGQEDVEHARYVSVVIRCRLGQCGPHILVEPDELREWIAGFFVRHKAPFRLRVCILYPYKVVLSGMRVKGSLEGLFNRLREGGFLHQGLCLDMVYRFFCEQSVNPHRIYLAPTV